MPNLSGPAVYAIDDDPAVRQSLTMLLEAEGFAVQTFASAEAFLAIVDTLVPGIVLSDVRMPGMDGIALIAALSDRGRTDPVIVVTGHADVSLAVQALKAGAKDFVEKPFLSAILLAAIAGCHIDGPSERHDRLATLTMRERQVFGHLLNGSTNKESARSLGISPRTVEIHRAHLMEKMDAHSFSQLVRMGIESGLDM